MASGAMCGGSIPLWCISYYKGSVSPSVYDLLYTKCVTAPFPFHTIHAKRGLYHMHYYIHCNQKNISSNHRAAIAEFEKRLTAYCNTTLLCETKPSFPNDIKKESHQILYICDGPSTYSSEYFANYIEQLQAKGITALHVLVGYTKAALLEILESLPDTKKLDTISISRFHLPTETNTLLFYEQLYRGYTILQGKTYHK